MKKLFDSHRTNLKPCNKVLKALGEKYRPENYDLIVARYTDSIAAVGLPPHVRVCLDIDDLGTNLIRTQLGNPSTPHHEAIIFKMEAARRDKATCQILHTIRSPLGL
ncbi:MAG: hypothetical protein ACI81V_000932 [Lentimonas sp.]|jgi:hypothetical protein